MDPFFSVVMPVYKVEDYLERAVSAVLSQDDPDFELILVDDGSPDGSPALCDQLAETDPRIRVIHKENGGLASARNAGLDVCRGQYVVMPDSDDYIEPNTLFSLRKAVSDNGCDMVNYDLIRHVDGKDVPYATKLPKGVYQEEKLQNLLSVCLLQPDQYLMSACTHAYRLRFLNENGLRFISEREVLSEDFLFNIMCIMLAKKLVILGETFYHYDARTGSLTLSPKPRKLERFTALYHYALDFAGKHSRDPEIQKKIRTYYVHDLFYNSCMYDAYYVSEDHSWEEAREDGRRLLSNPEVREAAKGLYLKGMNFKDRLRMAFVRWGFEPGVSFTFRKRKKEKKVLNPVPAKQEKH